MFGFCDVQNNQGLGKSYQLQLLVFRDKVFGNFTPNIVMAIL